MPNNNSSNHSFKQEMMPQWKGLMRRVFEDIPSFGKIWNPVMKAEMRRHADHRIGTLSKYINSLEITLQQTLYSLDRLRGFSTTEASNVSEFYVSHYLYDFLTRVKTVTDLLGLMTSHIFELNLDKRHCSLEKGRLCNRLIHASKNKNLDNVTAKQLGLRLDKARNDWLKPFSKLRDLVIHRAGLRFVGMGVDDAGKNRVHIAAGEMLRVLHVADEREVLAEFLAQVVPTSMSKYQTIDPVELSEQLWKRVTGLVEFVINECQIKILTSIHPKM